MDASLIHLIPNLIAASRSNNNATTARQPSYPTDPPPPYTPGPQYQPSTEKDRVDIPLTLVLLGPSSGGSPRRPIQHTYTHDIAIGPQTDYWEFLGLVRPLLATLGVDPEWEVAIAAEIRGRAMWKSHREDVEIVGEKNWREVLGELEMRKVRGLKVMCWRK
ncbi:hypothetical protein Q7P37_010622 [Cladosporium fusiforme]